MLNYLILLIAFLISPVSRAQYFPEQHMRVIDGGYIPDAKYIATGIVSNSYIREGVSGVVDEIATMLGEQGGNIATIYTQSYRNGIRNVNIVIVDIWLTDNPEHVKMIPEKEYFDSIRQVLFRKNPQQAFLIIVSTPHKPSSDMGVSLITLKVNGETEACGMQQYAYCDFSVEKETDITLITSYNASDRDKIGFPGNIIKDDEYTLTLKPGEVHFLSYIKKSYTKGEIFPINFNDGYRIYRWYAKLHSR